MKKQLFILSIFTMLSLTAHADDEKKISTRVGKMSVIDVGSSQQENISLKGKNLFKEEYGSYRIARKFIFSDRDLILVSSASGASCELWRFITVSDKVASASPVFGTCDENPKITQKGSKIMLTMNDVKGNKTQYTFENGVVLENGKSLKIPYTDKNNKIQQKLDDGKAEILLSF